MYSIVAPFKHFMEYAMRTALAVFFALAATAVFAALEEWSRPGGFNDQAKAGSLSGPVTPCPVPVDERVEDMCLQAEPG